MFKAVVRENTRVFAIEDYTLEVTGTKSGSNPTGVGTAVWNSYVRAVDVHPTSLGKPVEGDASIAVDLNSVAPTADVSFTGFPAGYDDMKWDSIWLRSGSFSYFGGFYDRLSGAF